MSEPLRGEMEFYRDAWYDACEQFRKLADRCGVDTTKPPPDGIMTAVDAINARLDECETRITGQVTLMVHSLLCKCTVMLGGHRVQSPDCPVHVVPNAPPAGQSR